MKSTLKGQWKCGSPSSLGDAVLNIFPDGDTFRMKITFPQTGFYFFTPNTCCEKEGAWCWEINDDHYRGICTLKLSEDDASLDGRYTQRNPQIDEAVHFDRVSDEPEDGEAHRGEPLVANTDKTRLELLREYAAYAPEKEPTTDIEYILGGKKPYILEKYGYSERVAKYTTPCDELVFELLDFVCDNFHHDGCNGMTQKRTIKGNIKFCEGHGRKTNCRGLAILLASLLRLNGIKAAHITCMPYEEPFNDCHVVVDCHMPSGGKLMLDPTYRLYITGEKGEYISLRRLRELLISGGEYKPNSGASYNGGGFDLGEQREYMTKNTFRFSRGTFYRDGSDDGYEGKCVELWPADYEIKNYGRSIIRDPDAFWD